MLKAEVADSFCCLPSRIQRCFTTSLPLPTTASCGLLNSSGLFWPFGSLRGNRQATTSTQLLELLILLQAAYQEGGFVLLLMQQDVPHLTEPLLLLLLFLVLCSSTAAPPSPAVVAASPLSLPGKVAIERGVIFWHKGSSGHSPAFGVIQCLP